MGISVRTSSNHIYIYMTKAHKSIFFEVFEDHVQGGARFYKLGDKLKIIIIIIRGPKLKIKNEI
jgi:hypothetical protein